MKFLTPVLIIIFASAFKTLEGRSHHNVKLILPDQSIPNVDIKGQCIIEGKKKPRVRVLEGDCNLKVLEVKKNLMHTQVYFIVKNVTKTCKYQCFFFRSEVTKTVQVVEAKISSSSSSIIAMSKYLPVTLNCTVTTSIHSKHYKLLWLENNTYVQSGNHYTIWSSQFDNSTNTQLNYLTIHEVINPAAYTCKLISTGGEVVDSKTQYISVNQDVSLLELIQYLSPYFKWNKFAGPRNTGHST